MGAFALPAALGLMASGTVTSAVGQSMSGKAAEKAAKFNAAQTKREADLRIESAIARARQQTATNVTRVAKSGVRLTGSPLAVIAENEFRASRDREFIRDASDMRSQLFRMQGRSARIASGYGIASSVLSGAGQIGSLAVNHRA